MRRDASVRPMSSGAGKEWLPTLGESWQVAHVAVKCLDAELVVQPLDAFDGDRLAVEQVLAAGDCRPSGISPVLVVAHRFDQASKSVKMTGVKAIPLGSKPKGSLIPM